MTFALWQKCALKWQTMWRMLMDVSAVHRYQGQAGYGATGVAVASVYGAADAGGYGSYGSAGNFGAAANAGYRGDAATASQYNGYGAANTAGTAGAGYGSQVWSSCVQCTFYKPCTMLHNWNSNIGNGSTNL